MYGALSFLKLAVKRSLPPTRSQLRLLVGGSGRSNKEKGKKGERREIFGDYISISEINCFVTV